MRNAPDRPQHLGLALLAVALLGKQHLARPTSAALVLLAPAAVAGNLGVADHWGFLCWSCLPSLAQVVLLPIGSIHFDNSKKIFFTRLIIYNNNQ